MKNILKHQRTQVLYRLVLSLFFLFTLFRLAFVAYFNNEINRGSFKLIFDAFLLGARFDLRLAIILSLFGLIIISLPIKAWRKITWSCRFYSVLIFLITLTYFTDAGYFAYLKSRLNATALQFLKNPIISFQMVSESYPVILFLFAAIVTSVAFYVVLRFFVFSLLYLPIITNSKKERFFAWKIFVILMALGLYGSLTHYPLRWSEAFKSPDNFSANLALNPILYMLDTYSFRNADFEEQKVRDAYHVVAPFLGVEDLDATKLNFLRTFPAKPSRFKTPPNIVVIIMESMAYFKTGIGGSAINPTPHLDQIAKESLLFNRFYTPTVATARSVFAAITSLPDVSKVKTSSRNPFFVNQHAIMSEFKEHDKFYFLGGSANWGNIRGVFSYNIPGLNIYEEGSYKSPRVDVWGISDLDLFKEANNVLKNQSTTKPFFAVIQSAGFHRPYTIPQNRDDFKVMTKDEISDQQLKDYGFESLEEFNAMRLQDYSLGRFIELAKKENYYDNTVFLVFGDHGIPHNNAKNVPDWDKHFSSGFHVPFIIHSPKHIAPGIDERIASELDVMPTIAGLTGTAYRTRGLGRDLFDSRFDKYRAAFSYNWYAPHHITLIDKDFYFELIPFNGEGLLLNYTSSTPNENVKEKFPEKYNEMKKLTEGLYETSKYLLHHNPHML